MSKCKNPYVKLERLSFRVINKYLSSAHTFLEGEVEELTDYEKWIQNNKNEKMAFLQSLKINEVKESFSEAVKDLSLTVGRKRIYTQRPQPVLRQKIARSSKVYIDLSEEAIVARQHSKARETVKKPIVVEEPSVWNFEDVLDSNQAFEHFIDDFKDLSQGSTETIDKYESRFQNIKQLVSHVGHFNCSRYLTAVDIHPMCEKTLIAGGGFNGNLYLWNINSDSEPYAFKVHSKSISHLKFNPENPHLIVCSSNDGSLREGDLVANVYKKVTNDTNCSYFDFLSPDTCLVSHTDGYVSVVDMREEHKAIRKRQVAHQSQDFTLRSVSVHPVNKNEFITPTHNGCVRLWDLRKLKARPVKEFSDMHLKDIYSAIFSPSTGKSFLTSSDSGRICTFDTYFWKKEPSCTLALKRTKHIRATWQPKTDSNFAVGSRTLPRKVEIYSNREKIFSYSHQRLERVIYFCAFHPSLPIIAAVQGSKVYVFSDKES